MKTKKMLARVLAVFLLVVTMIPMFAITAEAATAWPSLSTGSYCEMIAPKTIYVYRNSSLTTRGTCSPAKSYNASIAKFDKCFIYQITANYVKISYPTSSGYRTGYVRRADLFGASAPTEVVTSQGKAYVYSPANTGTQIGYCVSRDTIYRIGTNGNYTLIIYAARSGNRAWKAGYVRTSDYNNIIKKVPTPTPSTSKLMSNVLYGISGTKSYITCGFDGYVSTSGRHEGIDFKRGNGYSVYALTSGVITKVTEGYCGRNGLSTIAIYDSTTDKTVIYLHSNPLDTLKVGDWVSVGQKIAVEDWRGCSSASGGHTHVEVRNGRKTSAAKSVNDYTLDNPNPTSFWQSKGYTVK